MNKCGGKPGLLVQSVETGAGVMEGALRAPTEEAALSSTSQSLTGIPPSLSARTTHLHLSMFPKQPKQMVCILWTLMTLEQVQYYCSSCNKG